MLGSRGSALAFAYTAGAEPRVPRGLDFGGLFLGAAAAGVGTPESSGLAEVGYGSRPRARAASVISNSFSRLKNTRKSLKDHNCHRNPNRNRHGATIHQPLSSPFSFRREEESGRRDRRRERITIRLPHAPTPTHPHAFHPPPATVRTLFLNTFP